MDQSDSSASDEPDEVQHPWPYLASMFRIKSIDGTKIKLTCLLCLPLHVEWSASACVAQPVFKMMRDGV